MNPDLQPRHLIARAALFFTIGAASSLACYLAGGATLQLPLGGVLFAALLVPPLCLTFSRTPQAMLVPAAISIGICLVWMFWIDGWFSCAIILLSFTAAIASAAQLLVRLRVHPVAAAALVTTLSLAWLTWPIWTSPWLAGHSVHWLVTLHPLFAINTVCINLGIWTEQRIAYQLTNLGQDVSYQLPTSGWPCVMFHAAISVVLLLLARARLKAPLVDD